MSSIRQARTYKGPEEHSLSRRLRTLLTVLIMFFVFFHAFAFFVIGSVRIQGESMAPELAGGNRVLVSRSAYGIPLPFTTATLGSSTPERGDVVVYYPPYARSVPFTLRMADSVLRIVTLQRFGLAGGYGESWEGRPVPGRVVAIPGDTVEILGFRAAVIDSGGRRVADIDERDGSVRVIRPGSEYRIAGEYPLSGTSGAITLDDGQYWIEGDNRGHALSSTHFGPVSGEQIRSRVFFRMTPVSRLGGVR